MLYNQSSNPWKRFPPSALTSDGINVLGALTMVVLTEFMLWTKFSKGVNKLPNELVALGFVPEVFVDVAVELAG